MTGSSYVRGSSRDPAAERKKITDACIAIVLAGELVSERTLRAHGVKGDSHKMMAMVRELIRREVLPADCVAGAAKVHRETNHPRKRKAALEELTFTEAMVKQYDAAWKRIRTRKGEEKT